MQFVGAGFRGSEKVLVAFAVLRGQQLISSP
jgi:hypothetical protein